MFQTPRIWVDPLRRTTSGMFTINVRGVAAGSLVNVEIKSPNCEYLKLQIATDSEGLGQSTVFLHSQFGEYQVSFGEGYEADPAKFWLGEIGTIGSPTSLSLVASKSRGQVGDMIQLWTAGDFISVMLPSGVAEKLPVNAGEATFILRERGHYSFIALSELGMINSSDVISVEVVASPPTGSEPLPPVTCRGAVTVTPSFTDINVESGSTTMLRLTVRNDTPTLQTVSLPAITLPAGMVSATPIQLTGEAVAANSARSFYFTVTVSGSETAQKQVIVPSNTGTYLCQGSQYYVLGGTASVRVEAAAATCGLEALLLIAAPTTVAPGGTTKLTYTVKNTGSSPVTNLKLMETPLPAGCTPTSISFTGGSLAPGATFTFEQNVVIANPGGVSRDVVFEIGANRVSGNCGSGVVYNPIPKSAMVTVTA